MNAFTPVVAQLDAETFATMHAQAVSRGLSDVEYASEAIRRAAAYDAEYRTFIQEGIDAADRGELISQAEMERWFEARVRARQGG
jgi:predicted transcriptional regulator